MTAFAMEHPYVVFALMVVTLLCVDNIIANICEAYTREKK